MTLRNTLAAGAAMLPLALLSTPAFAQSTGSQDFENEIVVTGTSTKNGVAGVIAPDTTKAKVVLTQEFIARQSPGQTINDVINQLPGVSFQNNDPFGSAGGKMTIRGFDNTRISQTFDGVLGAVPHRSFARLEAAQLAALLRQDGLLADLKGLWRDLHLPREIRRWVL